MMGGILSNPGLISFSIMSCVSLWRLCIFVGSFEQVQSSALLLLENCQLAFCRGAMRLAQNGSQCFC